MSAINRVWILAGHAIFTVRTSAAAQEKGFATHYTFKIEKADMPASDRFPASRKWFVRVLTGPDNTADYSYLGILNDRDGTVRLTAKSMFAEDAKCVVVLRRSLARIWADEADSINANGWGITHAGCCGRCGALLTVPESVATGYGPECVKKATGKTMRQYIATLMQGYHNHRAENVEARVAAEDADADHETAAWLDSQRAMEESLRIVKV